MNQSKYTEPDEIQRLLPSNPLSHAAEFQLPVSPGQPENTGSMQQPTESQGAPIEHLRYARNARGILSNRDPEVLRRYILDAESQEERTQRQIELFQCASVSLGCIPSGHKSNHLMNTRALEGFNHPLVEDGSEPFNCGVFACPIVVTFARSQNIFKRLPLDHYTQVHVTKEIEKSLALCSATPLVYARVESMISVCDLNGFTPLQIQTAVSNETRRLSGDFKASEVQIPELMKSTKYDSYRRHQGGWSLKLPQADDLWTLVGPSQPIAFLLILYCGWNRFLPSPQFFDNTPVEQKHRLQNLLQGYLAQDRSSGEGELGTYATPDRVRVDVGRPMWMHEALTQAQVMQFKRMANRADRTQCCFDLQHEQRATTHHWTARISPIQFEFQFDPHLAASTCMSSEDSGLFAEQPIAVVDHVYDGFWRPDSHVQQIEQQVLSGQSDARTKGNQEQTLGDERSAPGAKLH